MRLCPSGVSEYSTLGGTTGYTLRPTSRPRSNSREISGDEEKGETGHKLACKLDS